MIKAIAALIAAFIVSAVVGKFLIPALVALKAGQSIREIGPKWHSGKSGTPTMGGIMFIAGSAVSLIIGFSFFLKGSFELLFVFLLALAYGLIGFYDDFIKVKKHRNLGLTAIQKFLLQIAAAVLFLFLMLKFGSLTNEVYLPFWNITFTIPTAVYFCLAVFIIVGSVNAVNLTDGIDGLAGGVTIPVMLFFAAAALLWAKDDVALFPAALAGALGGFLIYNFHPAKVFMGDTGSLFLGGAVCGVAFALDMPLILIVVGLIYIIETLSVILQVASFKLSKGKWRMFKMSPIHHHFELCGWSEVKIFVVFVTVTVLLCVLAWFGIRLRA